MDGVVAELFETDVEILALFNPNPVWTEITDATPVSEGWLCEAGCFAAPPVVAPALATAPTIAELQFQIQRLSAQLSALG